MNFQQGYRPPQPAPEPKKRGAGMGKIILLCLVLIVVGVAVFVVGGWYPFLREMVWITPITASVPLLLLVAGTGLFPDKPEEREEVEAFFRQITTPQG